MLKNIFHRLNIKKTFSHQFSNLKGLSESDELTQ